MLRLRLASLVLAVAALTACAVGDVPSHASTPPDPQGANSSTAYAGAGAAGGGISITPIGDQGAGGGGAVGRDAFNPFGDRGGGTGGFDFGTGGTTDPGTGQ